MRRMLSEEQLKKKILEYAPGGEGAVQSVNGETGDVVLTASDIMVTNSTSVQANLERIDLEVEGIIDDLADKQDKITGSTSLTTGSLTVQGELHASSAGGIFVGNNQCIPTSAGWGSAGQLFVSNGNGTGSWTNTGSLQVVPILENRSSPTSSAGYTFTGGPFAFYFFRLKTDGSSWYNLSGMILPNSADNGVDMYFGNGKHITRDPDKDANVAVTIHLMQGASNYITFDLDDITQQEGGSYVGGTISSLDLFGIK